MTALKSRIRHVPDFPKAGILFYDVTTVLRDPQGFKLSIDSLTAPFEGQGIEIVVRGRPEPRRICAGAEAGKTPGADHPRDL